MYNWTSFWCAVHPSYSLLFILPQSCSSLLLYDTSYLKWLKKCPNLSVCERILRDDETIKFLHYIQHNFRHSSLHLFHSFLFTIFFYMEHRCKNSYRSIASRYILNYETIVRGGRQYCEPTSGVSDRLRDSKRPTCVCYQNILGNSKNAIKNNSQNV
jgi:hypothetical protein